MILHPYIQHQPKLIHFTYMSDVHTSHHNQSYIYYKVFFFSLSMCQYLLLIPICTEEEHYTHKNWFNVVVYFLVIHETWEHIPFLMSSIKNDTKSSRKNEFYKARFSNALSRLSSLNICQHKDYCTCEYSCCYCI